MQQHTRMVHLDGTLELTLQSLRAGALRAYQQALQLTEKARATERQDRAKLLRRARRAAIGLPNGHAAKGACMIFSSQLTNCPAMMQNIKEVLA